MDNDKAFAIYALVVVGGAICVISALVATGIAAVPAPLFLLEHVALGLLIRASYKSFGGFTWPFASDEVAEEAAVEAPAAPGLPSLS